VSLISFAVLAASTWPLDYVATGLKWPALRRRPRPRSKGASGQVDAASTANEIRDTL